mmetsp:Transcript_10682/g.25484  ORF Transcript_10682/g.25484 Transcript_10682/m.25484 type:complete len:245 (-) Transcript_10682:340-1074(-)|eukprot:CAMPEP_0113477528 /NCGR_PEP_ID=MMETSP0014_2-20120614/20255_1 /TAXON_ID=2857 /ORGANISM="Nitzschia sp." /LENGTH=244 /DNA_ID=CAMNT_0000370627 /DNA_START=15 /DNA_END=749 /DNA_ORIENTATION=+ /assembly_acc=CAM_ASM_000159
MTILRRLQRAMEHHPILTNSVICLGLWVTGDGLAQVSEIHYNSSSSSNSSRGSSSKRHDNNDNNDHVDDSSFLSYSMSRYDWYRTVKCASYGALISGPVLAAWYPWLDRLFTTKYKLNPNGWAQAVAKVAADEIIMEPPTLFVFYGYMNVFEGGTMTSFWQKLDQEFITSWVTSITYWPPVSLLSFRFLPVYWQAPIINLCCIIWDGYLSHRNTAAIQEQQHRHDDEEAPSSQPVIKRNPSTTT